MTRKSKKQRLEIIHPRCAGIDIGSREHWVAVDPGQDDEPVRCFSAFSDDLYALADWLESMNVEVVAMEATGVYWIPLYEVLDARGLQVHIVNVRATRQASGRKSDVLDCQWIWQLMSHGLLRGAFRPADQVCVLRSLVRQRATKVQEQARCVLHMQKALTQMNVQLDNVVSSLTGKTGMAILRSMVAGERDPRQLAKLRDGRLRADEATVARSLYGNWRTEHLFALTQALAHYDFELAQIQECDQAINQALIDLPVRSQEEAPTPVKPLRSPLCRPSGSRRYWSSPARLGQTCRVSRAVDISVPGSVWPRPRASLAANRCRGKHPRFSTGPVKHYAKPPRTHATVTVSSVRPTERA